MTEATGTAVAQRDADDEAVGTLPKEIQQALELRKMQNMVAAKLAGMSWGQNLDYATRRALAEYGRRYNIDVTTEIDILGNRPYLNSRYYLRRLAELVARGLVEYAFPDHIEDDPRLLALAEDGNAPASVKESAVAENYRRALMRIEFQVPDAAASAVVFRVKLRSMDKEIVGCKWAGGGTREKDPIGEKHPVESSESRAARRAMRQLVSHVPALGMELGEVESAAAELEGAIRASTENTARDMALDPGRRDTRALQAAMQEEYSGGPLSPPSSLPEPAVRAVEKPVVLEGSLFPDDEQAPPFQMD